jgi:hypothetical protein
MKEIFGFDQLHKSIRRLDAMLNDRQIDNFSWHITFNEELSALHEKLCPLFKGGATDVIDHRFSEPVEKFAMLDDLGVITVPDGYDHANQLAIFMKKNRKKFYDVNKDITDVNFSNPTRVLKSGDKLRVRVFKQVVGGITTSEERMAFLATQKAIHTGAQGASLVFEQKRDQLPRGKWYTSFDEPERLWKDSDGHHRVPYLYHHSDGDWYFYLDDFENVWDGGHCFLCFCDLD